MSVDKVRIQYPDPGKMYLFLEREYNESTKRALEVSRNHTNEKISDLLGILEFAVFTGDGQTIEGATYKSLAFLAHQYGLDNDKRRELYEIAKNIPLSQSHVSFMTKVTMERNQLHSDLEKMMKEQG